MHRTTRGSGDRPPTATGPRPTTALTSQLLGPTCHSAGLCARRATPTPHVQPRTRIRMHPGGFVVSSAGRRARAGLRGRNRRSGVPGTESHDTGPALPPMARAGRMAASIPTHASIPNPSPNFPWWWVVWHPAPFPSRSGNQWSVGLVRRLHKHQWPTARIANATQGKL